ncbi:hypothetical protein AX769_14940 [Frondihabitans sp. PAMC 28766]|nr:hypothetical protein AX769_14940 [Frondihabitans sp. PAMC 28766]
MATYVQEIRSSDTRPPIKVSDVVTTHAVVAGGGLMFVGLGWPGWGPTEEGPIRVLGYVLVSLGVLAFVFAVGYGVPRIVGLVKNQPRRLLVEKRFAAVNDFAFCLSRPHDRPPFTGIPFRMGEDRVSFEVMRSNQLPFVEWGNYRYSLKRNGGRNVTFVAWGYLRVPLAGNVPNALFCLSKVKQMRRLTRIDLPRSPASVSPYDLYCEPRDEKVVMSVLDSDMVALLRNNKFSFEFAEGYFYVHFAGLFRFWKPETVTLLAEIVSRVEAIRLSES